MIMSKANIVTYEMPSTTTFPANANRRAFMLQMTVDGTVEFGEGGGAIPIRAGEMFTPRVVPLGVVKVTTAGTFRTNITCPCELPEEIWAWTLTSSSYTSIPLVELDETAMSMTFTINTTNLGTIYILQNTSGNGYIRIGGGHVRARFYNDDGTYVSVQPGTDLADGEDHTITVSIAGGTLTVTVDGTPSQGTISGTLIPITANQVASVSYTGTFSEVTLTGITNTADYPTGTAHWALDEPYSDDHTVLDSVSGVVLTKINDLPEDYTQLT